jgi:hypothetical protein
MLLERIGVPLIMLCVLRQMISGGRRRPASPALRGGDSGVDEEPATAGLVAFPAHSATGEMRA